jgi:hypothetical protein
MQKTAHCGVGKFHDRLPYAETAAILAIQQSEFPTVRALASFSN